MSNTPPTTVGSHGTNRSRTVFQPHGKSAQQPTPANTVLPFILGTPTQGQTLTVNVGTWEPVPTQFTYQWLRSGAPIQGNGSTGSSYVLVAADVGSTIQVTVTGTNGTGSGVATSLATAVVITNQPPMYAPAFSTQPSITGSAVTSTTFTGNAGLITGNPAPTLSVLWLVDGVASANTTYSYSTTTADLGKRLSFQVTASNSLGSVTATSSQSQPIQQAAPPATYKLGINLSGMEYGDSFSTYAITIPDTILDEVKAKKITDIRIPLSWDRIFPLGTPTVLSTTGYANLKDLLTRLGSRGMTGIVDIHNFGGRDVLLTTTTSPLNDTTFTGWTGEDCTPNATGFIESLGPATYGHRMRKSFNIVAGSATVTLKIKKYQGTGFGRIIFCQDTTANALQPQFNLNNGTITSGYDTTNGTAAISGPDSNGYYTVTLTYPVTITALYRVYIEANLNAGNDYVNEVYTGDGVSQPFQISSIIVNNTGLQQIGASVGSTNLPASVLADNWKTLVTQLRADSLEGYVSAYDLMNEPNKVSDADTWFNVAQTCINSIRTTGSTKCILVEGLPFSGAGTFPEYNPNLWKLTDPANNWLLSGHCYGDYDSSGGATGTPMTWAAQGGKAVDIPTDPINNPGQVVDEQILVSRADKMLQWAKGKGLRSIHIGEFGIGRDSIHWNNQARNLIAWAKTNNIWLSMWAGGPAWGDAYPLRLTSYTDGLQAEQMAVFDEANGNAAPTVYRLTVPTRLASGATTIPVTVQYNGLIASPITFTLSDSAGGTFSPATLTTDVSENWTGTAQLTPVASTNSLVTVTNNKGLINPNGKPTSSKTDSFTATEAAGVTTGVAASIWRRIYGAYTGPLVKLWRSSDSTTADIPFVAATGLLDRTAESAFTTGGGTIRVARVYDQSGSGSLGIVPRQYSEGGWPALPPAATEYPLWISDDGDGFPAMSWTGTNYMDVDYTMINRDNTTVIAVAKQTSGGNAINWQFSTRFLAFPTVVSSQDNASQTLAPTGSWCQTIVSRLRNSATGLVSWVNGTPTSTSATLDKTIQVTTDYRNQGSLGYYRFASPGVSTWTGKMREMIILNGVPANDLLTPFWTDANTVYTIYTPPAVPFSQATAQIVVDLKAGTVTDGGVLQTFATYVTGSRPSVDGTKGTFFGTGGSTYLVLQGPIATLMATDNWAVRFTVWSYPATTSNQILSTNSNTKGFMGGNGYFVVQAPGTNTEIAGTFNAGVPGRTTDQTQYLYAHKRNALSLVSIAGIFCTDDNYAAYTSATPALGEIRLGIATGQYWIEKVEFFNVTPVDAIEALNATRRNPPVPANYLPNWLLGFNYSGMDFGSTIFPDVSATGSAALDHYKALGFNFIRLPFLLDRWQNGGAGTTISASYTSSVKAFVDLATGKGFYILLEDHQYGNYQGAAVSGSNQANWLAAWTQIWAVFKTNTLVYYEVMNEPVGQASLANWVTYQQAWVNAARAAGVTTTLSVTWNGYSNGLGADYVDGDNSNADQVAAITDSLNNLIYQGHMYLNPDFSGSNNMSAVRFKYEGYSYARRMAEWARKKGKRILIGETGANYDFGTYTDQAREFRYFMQELYANRDAFIGITIWGGGPYWGDGYPYNVWPTNAGTPSQTDKATVIEMAKYPGYIGASNSSAQLQFVASGGTHLRGGSFGSIAGSNDGIHRRQVTRTFHEVGASDVSEMHIVYGNWQFFNDPIPLMNTAGQLVDWPSLNVSGVGVYFPTAPAAKKTQIVKFGGAAGKNMPWSLLATPDVSNAEVLSDAIDIAALGWTTIPAGTPFIVTTQVDLPVTWNLFGNPNAIFLIGTGLDSTLGEGSFMGSNVIDYREISDGSTPGSIAGSGKGYGPYAIVGKYTTPTPSILILGDSIIDRGGAEDGQGGTTGKNGGGQFLRGIYRVNGKPVAWTSFAQSGSAPNAITFGYQMVSAGANKQAWDFVSPYVKYATHLMCNYAHNTFSYANAVTQNTELINRIRAIKPNMYIFWEKMLQDVGSSDNWSTYANQDAGGYTWRAQWNTTLYSWRGAATGVKIDEIIDTSSVTEPAANKWPVNGTPFYATADGTHPAKWLHIAIAPLVTSHVSGWYAIRTGTGLVGLSTTPIVTLGTEINVSSKVGDLTNAYQADIGIDPTNASRQVITAKYGTAETQTAAFTTNDAWTTATKIVATGNTADADIVFDKNGVAYQSYIDRTNSRISVSSKAAGGTTWASSVSAASLASHPSIWSDSWSVSPYYNRLYVSGGATGPILARSDNGTTWTTATLSAGVSKFDTGMAFRGCSAQGGVVAFPWKSAQVTGVINGAPGGVTSDFYVIRSTNGGASIASAFIYASTPVSSPGVGGGFFCSNMAYSPPTVLASSGRLHLIIGQDQNNAPTRMMYFTSDDLGLTWSSGGQQSGRYIGDVSTWGALCPTIVVNAGGVILVQWMATNGTSLRTYCMASKDNGANWSDPVQVNSTDGTVPTPASQPLKPSSIQTYGGVALSDGTFQVCWPDARTNNNVYAIYTRKVTVT